MFLCSLCTFYAVFLHKIRAAHTSSPSITHCSLQINFYAHCRVQNRGSTACRVELARVGLQGGVVRVLDGHTEGVAGRFAQPRNREAETCGSLFGCMAGCLSVARGGKGNVGQLPACIEHQRAEHYAVFAYLEGVGVCRSICPPNKGRLVARRRYRNIFVGCLQLHGYYLVPPRPIVGGRRMIDGYHTRLLAVLQLVIPIRD